MVEDGQSGAAAGLAPGLREALVRARRGLTALALAVGAMLPMAEARATWSIVLIDTRTGEVAAASATCLTGRDLRADTPVLITGVGAATAQSFVDTSGRNRRFIAHGLSRGLSLQEILDGLDARDDAHQTRQYGMADASGDTLTFTGTGAGEWAGGQTGSFQYTHAGRTGTIVYAVQGNVLAGGPVVQQAIDAITQIEGDLPARLMAGMEAAHAFGGDGRCSCGPDADACGAPPPGFDPEVDKSAHIAYMLIARLGDANGCGLPLVYSDTAQLSRAVGAVEMTGDGMPDLLVAGRNDLFMLPNLSGPGDPLVSLGDSQALGSFVPDGADLSTLDPADMAIADVTGDARPDLVLGVNAESGESDSVVTLQRGQAGGTFAPPEVLAEGGMRYSVVARDLDADGTPDIAWSSAEDDEVRVLLADGQGGFDPPATVSVQDPGGLAALPDASGGPPHLVATQTAANTVAILENDGSGGFSVAETLAVGAAPRGVATGDFDSDGAFDIAAANSGEESVTVLLRNAGGGATRADADLPLQPDGLNVADVDQDGDPDLLARGGRITANALLTNQGDGAFDFEHTFAAREAMHAVVADLNADGHPDIAQAVQARRGSLNPSVLVNTNNRDAIGPRFSPVGGCASGDYFGEFNVAFTEASDPDPTLTLRQEFDSWRAGLDERPDAVVSRADLEPDTIVGDGATQSTMVIDLRDYQQDAVTMPVDISVTHAPNSAGLSSIGPVSEVGSGVYEVPLMAGVGVGVDRFRVEVDDGLRPVRLMPRPELGLRASAADINGDGVVDGDDFMAYLDAFAAGNTDLCDLTGPGDAPDGVCTSRDFLAFISAFAGQ